SPSTMSFSIQITSCPYLYTLSLHDALPISFGGQDLYPTVAEKASALAFSLIKNHPFIDGNKRVGHAALETFLVLNGSSAAWPTRSEEHTSELQSRGHLVCRLLLEKKKYHRR